MATLSNFFVALFMAALLLAGHAVHADACPCHGHDEGSPGMSLACMAEMHADHGLEGGHGCSCSCHDLSHRVVEAVSTQISVPSPLFVPRPCISDHSAEFSIQLLPVLRVVVPEEAEPGREPHKGFVCPLRS